MNKENKNAKRKFNNYRDQKENTGDFESRKFDANSSDKRFPRKKQDSSWYRISDNVNSAIANVPFNRFPGNFEPTCRTSPISGAPVTTVVSNLPNSTPGVMALHYINTYGGSGTPGSTTVSAADTTAKALYTYVRHQNSGHANYDSVDLMLYIMAMDNIYSYYFELKRILAIVSTYELVNRNVPDLLLTAEAVDAADLRANLSNYRGQLNLLAAKISSMAVPNEFHIFKRHALLASSVFVDSESRRAQFYIHTLVAVRQYDPAYNMQGGGLRTVSCLPTTPETFGVKLARLASMVDAVISDEDMNIMSGDILKAFSRENLYVISEADASETVAFIYNTDVLQQIENCMCVPIDPSSVDIHQANNSVIEDLSFPLLTADGGTPGTNMSYIVLSDDVYFNSHKEEVTPDDCMEYSRLMPGVILDSVNSKVYVRPGSELVVNGAIHTIAYSTAGVATIWSQLFDTVIQRGSNTITRVMAELAKFDWHPQYLTFNMATTTATIEGWWIDLKKYTLVSNEMRMAMNDVAVMAELGSLVISKFNKR